MLGLGFRACIENFGDIADIIEYLVRKLLSVGSKVRSLYIQDSWAGNLPGFHK